MEKNNQDIEFVLLHISNADDSITDFAVKKDWLKFYLSEDDNYQKFCNDDDRLKQFLGEYTSEDTSELFAHGLLANVVAFYVDPSDTNEGVAYNICGSNEPWKTKALIDYISQELQNNGFENASKFLDCKFDL